MSRNPKVGVCRLCGYKGILSFEHVPPKGAFNDRTVFLNSIEQFIEISSPDWLDNLPKGRQNQKGAGGYTLCKNCNSETGAWYAREYIELAKTLYGLYPGEHSKIHLTLEIRPQNFIKQVATMFMSACPGLSDQNSEMVRSLKTREAKLFTGGISFYVALYDLGRSQATRQSGITGAMSLGTLGSKIYAEISFPPFIFVMTLDKTRPPDERLTDITWFNLYEYNKKALIGVSISDLPVVSWLPGDYRNKRQILDCYAESIMSFE